MGLISLTGLAGPMSPTQRLVSRFNDEKSRLDGNRLHVQPGQHGMFGKTKIQIRQKAIADNADPVFLLGEILNDFHHGAFEDVARYAHGLDGRQPSTGMGVLDGPFPDGLEANGNKKRIDASDMNALLAEPNA